MTSLDLFGRPGISPDELLEAKLLPIARNALYEALARGDIESFRIGKKIVIPTAPLRRKFGMEGAAEVDRPSKPAA